MIRRTLVLGALAVGISACAAAITYGELPPAAIHITEAKAVSAEICRDHLFDPSSVQARFPAGYHFISAADYAKEEVGVTALVTRDARYATYAVGSLCFVSMSSFVVDDVRVHSPGAAAMAFWWARAEGARDPRMQGDVNWLQLASWYGRDFTDRGRIVAADPMAQFVDLEMIQVEPDLWRLRLALTDEVIEAEVRVGGQRIKRNAPEPGFTTVPLSGDSASYFMVFTYFGHHHRTAEGKWQARGSGVFSRALQIPDETSVFKTLLQDGWQSLWGLYKFER